MAATGTLSIWLERTDARAGLYSIQGQLAMGYMIGSRSKLQREYRGMGWDPEPSKCIEVVKLPLVTGKVYRGSGVG